MRKRFEQPLSGLLLIASVAAAVSFTVNLCIIRMSVNCRRLAWKSISKCFTRKQKKNWRGSKTFVVSPPQEAGATVFVLAALDFTVAF